MRKVIALFMPLAGLARDAWCFVVRPRTIGAKAILVNRGEVLLVRHTYERGIWGLPGGGLRSGEDPLAGVQREVREELGLSLNFLSLGIVKSNAEYKRDTVHVFTAELASRDGLVPDPLEIAELRWYSPAALPRVSGTTRKIFELFTSPARGAPGR